MMSSERDNRPEQYADIEKYERRAKELFFEGYNCAQAVFLTFAEDKMDVNEAARIASVFGGGLGGMRHVCGAVSGMAMAYGMLRGYSDPKAKDEKKAEYEAVKEMSREFEDMNGSIICRELLGLDKDVKYVSPSNRSGEYYKKRPCPELCSIAAGILAKRLNKG